MSTIVAMAKYLAYAMGGAEKSTLALLEREAQAGHNIVISSLAQARFLGKPLPLTALPAAWANHPLSDYLSLKRFAYWEYVFNRRRLARHARSQTAEVMWTYGFWAPAARAFDKEVVCFLRSETDLGIQTLTETGARRALQLVYRALEWPAKRVFLRDLGRLMTRSRVVANSRFMAEQAWQRFGVRADIVLPFVDVATLRAQREAHPQKARYVVFVGDSAGKGLHIVLHAARQLPHIEFRIFSRLIDSPVMERNIEWRPWQTEAGRVYDDAALVVCPAQWIEAYGRVAREAFVLGIPVLASRLGGLPEAVDDKPECLIDRFKQPQAWAEAIAHRMRSPADHVASPSQRQDAYDV